MKRHARLTNFSNSLPERSVGRLRVGKYWWILSKSSSALLDELEVEKVSGVAGEL